MYWTMKCQISIRAEYLPGVHNRQADALSCYKKIVLKKFQIDHREFEIDR
jgi:hypothetical protein